MLMGAVRKRRIDEFRLLLQRGRQISKPTRRIYCSTLIRASKLTKEIRSQAYAHPF